MRLHAQCTLSTVATATDASRLSFLNVAPATPGSNPSVANKGFRADATGLFPRASIVSAAGVFSAGTAAQTRAVSGQYVLGLEQGLDRTRGHVQATLSGQDISPPTPTGMPNLVGKLAGYAFAALASAANQAIGATGVDVNVVLSIGSMSSGSIGDLSSTGGGLIHVLVHSDDFQASL